MDKGVPHSRRSRAPATVAVAVVIAIIITAGAGAWYYGAQGHSGAAPRVDGPTFYQAFAAVNESVGAIAGGPWTLYGVWGIATPLPFSPNALGWPSNNLSINSCGAQFNGLTLWNGSIPLFDGSFDSGTAPFWQFAFFSNASQGILIATDVSGVTHIFPPMGMSSTCARATALGATPWGWARLFSPFPANSPIMAVSAWNAIGKQWMTANAPAWEAYILGFGYWGSTTPNGLIVKFDRCGQVGATGVQPVVDVGLNNDGSWNNYFNGTQGCGDVVSLGPPPIYGGYSAYFSPPTVSPSRNTTLVNQSFQVTYGNLSDDPDAGGLVSWMTTLNLSNAVGRAASICRPRLRELGSLDIVLSCQWFGLVRGAPFL